FGGVDNIRKLKLIQIIDGLEKFDVSDNIILGRNDDQHAIFFAPKACFLELLSKSRLGKNAAWKVITPIIDVEVKCIEQIDICFPHGSEGNRLTFEHDF